MKPLPEKIMSRMLGHRAELELVAPSAPTSGTRVSQSEIRALFADVFEDKGFVKDTANPANDRQAA